MKKSGSYSPLPARKRPEPPLGQLGTEGYGHTWDVRVKASGYLLIALLGGCTPNLGAPAGATAGSSGVAGAGSGGSGGATSGPATDPCVNGVAVSPTPLRRLTRGEFDRAVRDLLHSELGLARDFPNDLPAAGFASNRADPMSLLGVEKLMLAAEAAAADAVTHLDSLVPCAPAQGDAACASQFFTELGRKAYRRSLTAAELTELSALYTQGAATAGGFSAGIQFGIERILQSPHFIYHLERTTGAAPIGASSAVPLTGPSVADRLAAFLWYSLPDEALLKAAEAGELDTPAGVAAQAERMLADAKGRDSVVEFFNEWLDIEKLETTEKNPAVFPVYTNELRTAMWQETGTFVDSVIRQGDGRLQTLLTSNLALPSGPLAAFYGLAPGAALTALDPQVRSGLLTHPSVLAVHAHSDQTSPVKRGAFIRDRVMCTPLPPPPPAVNDNPPMIDPKATTRVRFEQHRVDPSCAACHALLDPVGFAFERYDGAGQYRTLEGGLPIDTTGTLTATNDIDGPFDGAVQLTQKLAGSAQVRDCMATQWLRYAMRQEEGEAEACSAQKIRAAFRDADGDIRKLILAVVQSDAFRYKSTKGTP